MNRVATLPVQQTLTDAIGRTQVRLAATQAQLSTGKRAPDYAGLGTDAVRAVSARSLLSRAEAQGAAATRVGSTLALYDANITRIDTVAEGLRQTVLTALGTGQSAGLQAAAEAAFGEVRTALNASEAGVPLFGGGGADAPFGPETLADTVGLVPADAFANGQARASARVGEGHDLVYGVGADELGSELVGAFRTLAEAGPFGAKLTAAQEDALRLAIGQIDGALTGVRAINADNGRRQAQAETLAVRADERALLLSDVIGRVEDADLGQVAADLARHQALLQASYGTFAKLSGLSLLNYLR